MPNGGLTPDCIHCKFFRGPHVGPWICTHHKIRLAIPTHAFCSAYIDPEPDDKGDWLDQRITRADLKSDWMYIWLDIGKQHINEKGVRTIFKHYPLVPIHEYKQWTYDMVLEAMQKINDERDDS